jgi:hypothetical protein
VSEVVERGAAEIERRAREAEEQAAADVEWNRNHVAWWFRYVFYSSAGHQIPNPDRYAYQRYVENPENPFPPIEEWRLTETSGTPVPRASSEFVCEGLRFRVRWKDERRSYGEDRASWDDGWWPEWYLVLRRPRRFVPFLRSTVEVRVWGEKNVAEALK